MKILDCTEFKCEPHALPSFTVTAETVSAGSEVVNNLEIEVKYRHDWKPIFIFKDIFSANTVLSGLDSITLQGKNFQNDVTLIPILSKCTNTGTVIYAISSVTPFLYGTATDVNQIQAVLLNGPPYLSDARSISITDDKTSFSIRPYKKVSNDEFEYNSESKPYGLLELAGKLTAEDSFKILTDIGNFLDFVTGMHCGIGHIVGYSNDGICAFCYIGFGKRDSGRRPTGWYDFELEQKLPNIYKKFTTAAQDPSRNVVLRQAMNYYRGSNVTRSDSLEIAIISSHASLESLVNFILEKNAGWSKELLDAKIKFSDKLRAAGKFVGVNVDLFLHSPELKAFSAARGGVMDGYEMVSFIRNKLVHQDKKLKVTGTILFESWNLSQWLVEIFIFYLIDYKDDMIDRRRYGGWRGGTVPVPLS